MCATLLHAAGGSILSSRYCAFEITAPHVKVAKRGLLTAISSARNVLGLEHLNGRVFILVLTQASGTQSCHGQSRITVDGP